ncbi:MAG TPA: serine/threonine-protein kinase, partial [Kofleriaceae bacterium]
MVGESERFDIRRQLGVGGMGIVYEAFDKQRSAAVALKTLKRLDATMLYRFKREFRFLTDVVHANLVQLYELFSAGDEWFFTMELIDGVSFLDHVRPSADADTTPRSRASTASLESESGSSSPRGGAIDLARLRPALLQLARGVAALHRAGRSHRDLKPSNVLVDTAGRVVICDFGLVTEIAAPEETQKQVIGTAAYMAPEQAAGKAVSAATDWYSVGVMLYEALTGRVPFGGAGDELLKLKDRVEPLPPSRAVDGIPPDLDALCSDLLRRDPDARPTGEQVLERLGECVAQVPAPVPTSAPFVGRGAHLAALHRAYDAAAAGQPVTIWVHGRSGAGKTTLVRRFIDEIRARNEAIVLVGRCYERESVPYKAMDSVIDALSAYLCRLPKADAERIMPRDVQVLARLFPVLRRIQIVAEPQTRSFAALDLAETRRRALAALRELLARLAEERPVVMWIDDLQWGDLDSAMMLAAVMRAPAPPHLMLVGSYRADDAGSAFLVALNRDIPHTDPDIDVGPLSDTEAQELARTILGDARSADVIAHESGGSPFFVHELARYVGGGADLATAERVTLDEVLRARLEKVPADARALLHTIAVAGHALPRTVALDAAGVVDGGNRAMAVLQSEHLVRTRGDRDHEGIETYHDRIRDAVC